MNKKTLLIINQSFAKRLNEFLKINKNSIALINESLAIRMAAFIRVIDGLKS